MLEVTSFGSTPDGFEASAYTLSTEHARARISDFGATLLGMEVPGRDGTTADVVLGFASVEGYAGVNGSCYGGVIGPMANRTDRAEVPVGGTVYHLLGNDGPNGENNLHSDLMRGLHKRAWETSYDEASNTLSLSCSLADGELGLPGERTFTATYELASDGTLALTYRCETDQPTFVNMTNHTYFNLAGHASGDVRAQEATVHANHYLPVREDSVSEGIIESVLGTPFDLRSGAALGTGIDAQNNVQIARGRGYDHCFCIDGFEPDAAPRPALEVHDPASGRSLAIAITQPGAHLYTGNWLEDASGVKDGAAYGPRDGFAFEPEFYPDNVHHAEWETPVCEPGRPYSSTIVWRFSVH